MADIKPARRCLKCRREFHPRHRHLFVCNACKATRIWKNPISEYALAGGVGAVGIDPGVPDEEPLPESQIGDGAEPGDVRRKE